MEWTQPISQTTVALKMRFSTTKFTDREVLSGLVERVTFHNSENGFCVLRTKARGHRELITVVGHAAVISAGEWVTASGEWVNDPTHGQQFRASFIRTSAPSSVEGIAKYLSSGMIRGIGPVYAKKLVGAFGETVFDVIEATPERLREVEGIGPVRATRIVAAWAEQKIVREIMVFLHEHGVGTARAVRIYKTYGADAVQVMSENPYRLARDIRGIGFKTADAIAMKLGIEKTAIMRVRAGISYALTEAMDEGHCGLPIDELVPPCRKTSRGPQRARSNRARSRTLSGRSHSRECWPDAVRVPRRPSSRRESHYRAAHTSRQWTAALAASPLVHRMIQ
jgi:exodeoxyribonuclease V alpha subunit